MLCILVLTIVVGSILGSFEIGVLPHKHQHECQKRLAMHSDPETLSTYEAQLLQGVGDRIIFTLLGSPLSYASAIDFARRVKQLDGRRTVVIYHLSHSAFVDVSAAQAIGEMIDLSERNGRYVILSGLRNDVLGTLRQTGIFDRLSETQCFENRRLGIEAAIAYCRHGRTTG